MSLIRQFWTLLVATVLVAVLGGVAVSVGSARDYLETQLRLKNSDSAQSLALVLSQQGSDAALLELALAAQFDTGFYERIQLRAPDGRVLLEHRAQASAPGAPAWFVGAVPIRSEPGVAQVSDGWRAIGSIEVISTPRFAHADLWRSTVRTGAWLALVGLAAGALGVALLRRVHAPLQATVEQAQGLVERRFITVPEHSTPELREVSRAMNSMVLRLKGVLEEQSTQIEGLRRETQTDALTGLAQRAHFLAGMASHVNREDGAAHGALSLVRVRELATLNRELGRHEADDLLRHLAQALQSTSAVLGESLAGRLNGTDFALLTHHASAAVAGAALQSSAKAALTRWPQAALAIGVVPWEHGSDIASLLGAADEALARAELHHGFSVEVAAADTSHAGDATGEADWRRHIAQSLSSEAAELGAFPLIDRHDRVVHIEAPLRLRMGASGAMSPAYRWLPWAQRGRLLADVDLLAVRLALRAGERDGQPRGVNLAADSLADGAFLPRLRSELQAAPAAAAKLWLEVGEAAALARPAALRELGAQVRSLGVKVGIEHAGLRLAQVDRLYELGLDYVKLDASVAHELASDRPRADFVRSLVSALHGMGAQVYAEGVQSSADAETLWGLGVDGITGPWASRRIA